jgi:hypothetical protein
MHCTNVEDIGPWKSSTSTSSLLCNYIIVALDITVYRNLGICICGDTKRVFVCDVQLFQVENRGHVLTSH